MWRSLDVKALGRRGGEVHNGMMRSRKEGGRKR